MTHAISLVGITSHLEGYLVLNCLLLVHVPQLGFIGPLFEF